MTADEILVDIDDSPSARAVLRRAAASDRPEQRVAHSNGRL